MSCSFVTDYVSEDVLHNWMSYDKHFGDFSHYQQKSNMIVVTIKPSAFPGAESSTIERYWKYVKIRERVWNAYEVDASGKQIGEPFELAESKK